MSRNVVFACVCTVILALPGPASAAWTYLALGDSLAFGETDFTQNPSNGDRGYVSRSSPIILAAFNNGVVPNASSTLASTANPRPPSSPAPPIIPSAPTPT